MRAACIPRATTPRKKTYVFNHDGIERVYSLGYQDERQIEFSEALMEQFRISKGSVSFD